MSWLRGTCSGRSKSRNLASTHEVAFRRVSQDIGKPKCQLFCSAAAKALYFVAGTVQEQSNIKFLWTTDMRVWTFHMRLCFVGAMIRAGVCRCVRVCAMLRWSHRARATSSWSGVQTNGRVSVLGSQRGSVPQTCRGNPSNPEGMGVLRPV